MTRRPTAPQALCERIVDFSHMVTSALLKREGRGAQEVEEAEAAVLEGITDGGTSFDEVLGWGEFGVLGVLERYIELVQEGTPISIGLKLTGEREWEYPEILAVVALVYLRHARRAAAIGTAASLSIAGMAYADALQYFAFWERHRGQEGDTSSPVALAGRLIEQPSDLASLQRARVELARRGGSSRAASKEMKLIHEEWIEAQQPWRRYPSDAEFARRAQAAHPIITNERSIQSNIAKWRRLARIEPVK